MSSSQVGRRHAPHGIFACWNLVLLGFIMRYDVRCVSLVKDILNYGLLLGYIEFKLYCKEAVYIVYHEQ